MSTFADAGMAERMKAREKRAQLKALLEEMPLRDVLLVVRDHIATIGGDAQRRAILTRSIEDAVVWLNALETMALASPLGG